MKKFLTRRRIFSALAVTATVGLLAGCSSGGGGESGEGGTITVAMWEGPITDAAKEVYFKPFTEETGIEVVVANADRARYVSSVESGNPEWDLFESDAYDMVTWANQGYLGELDADLPRSDLLDPITADHSIGGYGQSFVLVYRESAYPEAPQNWADFWDTEKFPGKRGFPSYYVNTIETALLADGVPTDEVYPLDLDRGFEKLDEIKPELTFFDSYSSITQGMLSGSVDMALTTSARGVEMMESDPDIKIQWNQNIFSMAGFGITKDGPSEDLMQQLAEYTLDPERQAEWVEQAGYAPTMSEAFDYLDEETMENLPGTPEHMEVAVNLDPENLSEIADEYASRYSAWVAE